MVRVKLAFGFDRVEREDTGRERDVFRFVVRGGLELHGEGAHSASVPESQSRTIQVPAGGADVQHLGLEEGPVLVASRDTALVEQREPAGGLVEADDPRAEPRDRG